MATLRYEEGHKNSKGEPAPWVIRAHETTDAHKKGEVIAAFSSEEKARQHMVDMHVHSGSIGHTAEAFIWIPSASEPILEEAGIGTPLGHPCYWSCCEQCGTNLSTCRCMTKHHDPSSDDFKGVILIMPNGLCQNCAASKPNMIKASRLLTGARHSAFFSTLVDLDALEPVLKQVTYGKGGMVFPEAEEACKHVVQVLTSMYFPDKMQEFYKRSAIQAYQYWLQDPTPHVLTSAESAIQCLRKELTATCSICQGPTYNCKCASILHRNKGLCHDCWQASK